MIGLGALLLNMMFAAWPAHAQNAGTESERCGEPTPYNPGIGLLSIGVPDCAEIMKEIGRGTERFLNGECAVLEARKRSLDRRSYGEADGFIRKAEADLAEASAIFSGVADEIDGDIALVEGEGTNEAEKILDFYGYPVPTTYMEAFKMLAEVMGDAAEKLTDVRFLEGGREAENLRVMYEATARPGGVFRAITMLVAN